MLTYFVCAWTLVSPVFLAMRSDGDSELARLKSAMSGSFTSAAQSKADPAYFQVVLHMTPIWQDRKNEHWLYVEQAMATAPDKPYRQRVYRLVRSDNGLVSRVYTLPGDPLQFAGAWNKPDRLAKLTPDQLTEKVGCSINLKRKPDGSFAGSTSGKECASDLRGATYATSEVTISNGTVTSWDRGYDSNDKQVWGATKGPYVFKKVANPSK